MGNNDDTIMDEVIEGLFGIFHNAWFWVFLLIVLGAYYGFITQNNVLHILDKVIQLASTAISKF